MKPETVDRLLTLALHEETPDGESTAAMARLLAVSGVRAMLRHRLTAEHRNPLEDRYNANRAELERAIRTIRELTRERDDAVAALHVAQREAGGAQDARDELARLRDRIAAALDDSHPNADDQNGRGADRAAADDDEPERPRRWRGGRRPRPVVHLDADATCHECGAQLHEGDPARVYPGGRVYGTECHGRRRVG